MSDAASGTRPPRGGRGRWIAKAGPAFARDVTLAVVIILLIGAFLAQPFRVEGRSMEPLLQSGQRVLVDKLSPRWSDLRRHDVVVLDASDGGAMIKRIVGLPGETVAFENGRVVIDGVALSGDDSTGAETAGCDSGSVTLGPDEYFVLGDNRAVSIDSRRFGAVRRSQVRGRAVLRYWPLRLVGRLDVPASAPAPR